jgi:hypothetical protein
VRLQSALETELEKCLVTIKHVRPVETSLAGGLVAKIYSQIKKDFALENFNIQIRL